VKTESGLHVASMTETSATIQSVRDSKEGVGEGHINHRRDDPQG